VLNTGILDIKRQHDLLGRASSLRWDRFVVWNYECDFKRVICAGTQVNIPIAPEHTCETQVPLIELSSCFDVGYLK
jgi:hypothetical protein